MRSKYEEGYQGWLQICEPNLVKDSLLVIVSIFMEKQNGPRVKDNNSGLKCWL